MRRPNLNIALALLALASPGFAQGFVFQVDPNATQFTWSGTTSVGDIVENPANFSLAGTAQVGMTTGGNPVGTAQFLMGGDAQITPDIIGEIPNPIPFLPPLATITLQNTHVYVASDAFPVSPTGDFTAQVTMHIISGSLIVDPITGTMTTTDLAGNASQPATAMGTLVWNGSAYVLSAPVSSSFPFSEPSSGITGDLTLNGTLVANHVPVVPNNYCSSLPNSTGSTGTISSTGSPSLGAGNLTLQSLLLPPTTFGLFFYGPNQIDLPFGSGRRCVGGSLTRFSPVNTGPGGSVSQLIDNSALPVQVMAGDQQNFQFWFRDITQGGVFNTSDALSVIYTP